MQLGEIEKSHSGRLHSFMNAILDTPENGQFSVLIILVSLRYLLTSGLNWSVRVCRNRASKQILWFLWKVLHDPDVNSFSRLPNLTRFNVLSIWWQNAVFSVIPFRWRAETFDHHTLVNLRGCSRHSIISSSFDLELSSFFDVHFNDGYKQSPIL